MPNFVPNVLDAEELSSGAMQVLRGAIRIALRNRSTSLHIMPLTDFYAHADLPASTNRTQFIKLLNEAKQALALFENELTSEDDIDTPTGSTPVFSSIYIINSLIGFSLYGPMYLLSEHGLNRLLNYEK